MVSVLGGAGRLRAGGHLYGRTVLYYRRVTVYQRVHGSGYIERVRAGHRWYSQEQRSAAADHPKHCLQMQWFHNQVDSCSQVAE